MRRAVGHTHNNSSYLTLIIYPEKPINFQRLVKVMPNISLSAVFITINLLKFLLHFDMGQNRVTQQSFNQTGVFL